MARTFKELKIGDFVYEIKKSYSDVYALKWKLTSEFNRDTESEHPNSYIALGKDPDGRLPERTIVVSAGSFGKSSYKNMFFADRTEAVTAYKKMIEELLQFANEDVERCQKHLDMAKERVNKYTARLEQVKKDSR
jgi:hypothetical protein